MNFLKKIFSPSCLSISFLILIYTFYKSEIYWNGEKSSYYLTFYILAFLLIIFSIISFFINQIFTFYLFEGFLNFSNERQLQKQEIQKETLYEKKTGKKHDKRTRFEIYSDLKKVNNKIVVTVSPNDSINKNNKIFPLSGISNSETIYCSENGYYSIYKSDRYGFNNPNEEWDDKKIENLLVGDSFAQGACVNRPGDIGSVLRKLSTKSVLNLGYSGNGPLIQYATLREYLNSNVKNVLWFYYEGNDLYNLESELNNIILKNYLDDLEFTQNLQSRQNEIDDLSNDIITKEAKKELEREVEKFNILNFFKLNNVRTMLSVYLPEKYQPKKNPWNKEFKKILKLAHDLSIKNKSKFYFIYLPEYRRYKIEYNNSNYLLVKKTVKELDISFIDIHKELFAKEKNSLKLFPFELEGHYNADGYRKIGKIIYSLIP